MSTEIQVWQVSDGHLQPLEGGLAEAGRILGIEVLDHLVVGDNRYVSLRQYGIEF